MSAKPHDPFFHRMVATLAGCWARRVYVAVVLLFICLTTTARLRSYLMVRKIQAVLHGLADIRIDQTTEEQLLKTVPYLVGNNYKEHVGASEERFYGVVISNEDDLIKLTHGPLSSLFQVRSSDYGEPLALKTLDWLGYRYLRFEVTLLVLDGRVSSLRYGIAPQIGFPRQFFDIVSARSVHGFWLPRQMRFSVTSEEDESPQYRVKQNSVPSLVKEERALNVTFTNDAPPELTKRAFQLNLSCFWSLRRCDDVREIAPGLWQDAQAIQAATYKQLISERCPDSIIEGRMRYLPDISVLLLEVTGSRRVEVNEEGGKAEDWFTDYRLREVIRGRSSGSWKNVRFRRTIPSPMDVTHTMANQIWPSTEIGTQVLYFGGLDFYSCRFIPATPSSLEIVRNKPVPTKRPEDEIPMGLQ
jgi:hypothetical protein